MNLKFFFLLFILFFPQILIAYPKITSLSNKDFMFKQFTNDVESNSRLLNSSSKVFLEFYEYTANKNDNIFSIAARCCLRQETIATINSIPNTQFSLEGKTIIIPTANGIFIPQENLSTKLEFLLSSEFASELETAPKVMGKNQYYYFLNGKKLSPSTRTFFVSPSFILPLEQHILTSNYGMRKSPVSGKWKFHHGIDMAAPKGSKVYAVAQGTVQNILTLDNIYGNCIIIDHGSGNTSLYAHLDSIQVQKGQNIPQGYIIGTVGTTGLSTGPHLHFELNEKGSETNPANLLPLKE